MNGTSKKAREQFRAFAARPGMFVFESYDDVASFIAGIDYAHDYALLDGFHDWLEASLGAKSPLAWSEQIKQAYGGMSDDEKRPFGKEPATYLLAQIERFLDEQDVTAVAAQ